MDKQETVEMAETAETAIPQAQKIKAMIRLPNYSSPAGGDPGGGENK